MADLPQLILRLKKDDFAPVTLAPEYSSHTHFEGNEKTWENIIESAFGNHYNFDFLIKAGNYAPERVFYISRDGQDLATTTAVEHPSYPGEGWLRMVGVKKEEAGKGLGKAIVSVAVESLLSRGYETVVLSTDDQRISAICTYLSLGFRPVYNHESHQKRWQELKKVLPEKFAKLI